MTERSWTWVMLSRNKGDERAGRVTPGGSRGSDLRRCHFPADKAAGAFGPGHLRIGAPGVDREMMMVIAPREKERTGKVRLSDAQAELLRINFSLPQIANLKVQMT